VISIWSRAIKTSGSGRSGNARAGSGECPRASARTRKVSANSSRGGALTRRGRGHLSARAAQPVEQAAEPGRIHVGPFGADVFFARGRIGAPHFLLQLAAGLRDLDELAALVDLAFAAPREPLVDQ